MDWKSKRIRAVLDAALVEDKVGADLTTSLVIDSRMRATGSIVALEPCVIAGLGAIPVLLEGYAAMRAKAGGASIGRFEVISHPEIFDGVKVKKGQTIAVIRSNAAALLSTERVMLNLMQRMSGIATYTNEFVRAVAGTRVRVLDTRKTSPGLRALDKYAVCCGGGTNQRQDLQDGILIKANHIAVAGGMAKALDRALAKRTGKQTVQVEVRTLAELDEAIAGHAEAYLLDHMTPAQVKKAVKQIREAQPTARIEASGSISLATVKDYAETGVDFVAIGVLTHSAPASDLSMRISVDVS